MPTVNLKLEGAKELKQKLSHIESHMVNKATGTALQAGGLFLEAKTKLNIQSRGLYDTGNLINSIGIHGKQPDYILFGSAGVEYAAIHEFGGTIRPLRAKNLAIPANKTARKLGSPRKFSNLRWIPGTVGKSYLVNDDGLQFTLVKSVTIPARPYLRPAYENNQAQLVMTITTVLRNEINKIA